jgi:autotransporter passenger strand-loop-strand repeat protein
MSWRSRWFRRAERVALHTEALEDRAVPALLGQQLFPADNPWNQNISSAPVVANSAAIIAHIGASTRLTPNWYADNPANGASPLYGMPFNVVHGNTAPKTHVVIDNYPGESDGNDVPIPAAAVIEGDFQNGPNPNGGGYGENGNPNQRGDSHLLIWDADNNVAFELYGVSRPNDPTLFPNTSGVELPKTDTLWHAAQESVWDLKTNTFRTLGETSADAAGLPILPGLARPDEGLTVAQGGQGVINHALRVTLPGGDINPQYVYPASHIVSVSQGGNNLPLGGRLRLANTPAVNALISNMPPESQILARAMQQYGLIVADIGSAMYVSGASASVDAGNNISQTWNLNDIFAANGLEALHADDFEVVDLAPRVTGLGASSGAVGSTLTITGQNFSGAAGHLSVLFGSTPASSVQIVSDTQITAVIPNGTGTVDVRVQSGVNATDNISSNPNANVHAPIFGYGMSAPSAADLFTITGGTTAVTVTGVSPASGPAAGGATVTITGSNFTGATAVSFGGTAATNFTVVSATQIKATEPAGTAGQSVDVTVTTPIGTSATSPADRFTFNPPEGPPTNLNATPGNGSVTFSFDPISLPVSFYPYAQLINGTLYPIYVGFGNPFTITATNAGPLVNGQTYTFEVAVTYADGNTSAWSGPVTVTLPNPTPSVPAVTGVSPASGPAAGGATVTITGANFTGATTVKFGTTPAASFTVVSATQIKATEPAGTAGQSVDVTVTTPAGTSATGTADTFKFVAAPTITTQPGNVTVAAGQPANFKVVATGEGLSYQWQKLVGSSWVNVGTGNTSGFTGATTANFTITSPVASDTGKYRVVVSNIGGTATSNPATLTITAAAAPPTVTQNPSNLTAGVGSTATFTAAASGSPAPTVQWQVSVNGGAFVNILGATSTAYSFTAAANMNGNQYRAVFTNSAGQAVTAAATLTTTTGQTVGAGQTLVVSAGQTVTGVTVLPGGYLLVLSGGTDVGTILDGGDETVQAGGLSIGATVDSGADIEVFGTATGLIQNDGYVNVDQGGTVTNTTINGDITYVSAGGTANNTTIKAGGSMTVIGGAVTNGTILNGGEEFVRSGAVTNGTTANNGGVEYVFAGGTANNLTLNTGGSATLLGAVNGATINAGGTATVFDGGSATGAIVDNGTLAFDLSGTTTFAGQLTGNGALAVQGAGKLVVAGALNNVAVTIGSSSSLEIGSASNATITFGYQSTLKLDDSLGFTGALAATPGYQDVIDLGDVPFILGVTSVTFVENAAHTQGVLTVSDGSGGPTVQLTLLGDFSTGTFTASSDGATNPGTLIKGPF